MALKLGIDRLVAEAALRDRLRGRRVAFLGHPASVTSSLTHSLDALVSCGDLEVVAAFGPQHGMRGEKQDNMIESSHFVDPVHGIPVWSLYGETRRPTDEMLDGVDVVLVDLQDLGCRIYTFVTTLLYVLEEAGRRGKAVWVLDRPNPIGRPIEGLRLRPGWESFVGAGPLPMRHGLTLGELGRWFVRARGIDVELEVVAMQAWDPYAPPGFGWPLGELSWVNPSPNAPNVSMARCYPGTVLIEGTELSEGRGTTRPLEVVGAPEVDAVALLREMQRLAPAWLRGCRLRLCYFEPTFHKHTGRTCAGVQIHVDDPGYKYDAFRPYRLVALLLKACRRLRPEAGLWRDFDYEYERDRLAIDVINGSPLLREWVDDAQAEPADLERALARDEESWRDERKPLLLYAPHRA
jgi:uncharacterized protein YbbC (DUF1343 family)